MEIRCYNALTNEYYTKEVILTEEELQKQFEDNKTNKLNELETYYNNLMEQGLNYNGYVYDISLLSS